MLDEKREGMKQTNKNLIATENNMVITRGKEVLGEIEEGKGGGGKW